VNINYINFNDSYFRVKNLDKRRRTQKKNLLTGWLNDNKKEVENRCQDIEEGRVVF
jgi:hypothetical protein